MAMVTEMENYDSYPRVGGQTKTEESIKSSQKDMVEN
jgi:hypothetical protein